MNSISSGLTLMPAGDAPVPAAPADGTGSVAGLSFGAILRGQSEGGWFSLSDAPPPAAPAGQSWENPWAKLAAFAGERDPATLPPAGPLALAFAGPVPEAPSPGPAMAPEMAWVEGAVLEGAVPATAPAATGEASLLDVVVPGEVALATLPDPAPQARLPLSPTVADGEDGTPALEPIALSWSLAPRPPVLDEASAAKAPAGVPAPVLPSPPAELTTVAGQAVVTPAAAPEPALKTPPPPLAPGALVAPSAPQAASPVADPAPEVAAAAGPVVRLDRYPVTRPVRLPAATPPGQAVAEPVPLEGQAGERPAVEMSPGEGPDDAPAAADKALTMELRAAPRAEPAAAFSREPAASLVHQSSLPPPRVDGQSVPGQPVPGQTPLQTPLNLAQPGWGQALGQQILWLVQNGPRQAELKVNPPHLGPLEVSLSLDRQQQASITFFAPDAGVREALEAALPRLRELFDTQGLHLQQANVSDQSLAGRQQGQAQAGQDGARPFGNAGAVVPEGGEVPAESKRRVAVGLVDQYV